MSYRVAFLLKIYISKTMSGIGLRWQAIGPKNAGKTCREISRELNVHFAMVLHCARNVMRENILKTSQGMEDPLYWIECLRLISPNLSRKTDSQPGNYPGNFNLPV